MGKGGTKFESEAIGNRDGRQKKGPSLKDLKKEMEVRSSTVSVRYSCPIVPRLHGRFERTRGAIPSNLSARLYADGRDVNESNKFMGSKARNALE